MKTDKNEVSVTPSFEIKVKGDKIRLTKEEAETLRDELIEAIGRTVYVPSYIGYPSVLMPHWQKPYITCGSGQLGAITAGSGYGIGCSAGITAHASGQLGSVAV